MPLDIVVEVILRTRNSWEEMDSALQGRQKNLPAVFRIVDREQGKYLRKVLVGIISPFVSER